MEIIRNTRRRSVGRSSLVCVLMKANSSRRMFKFKFSAIKNHFSLKCINLESSPTRAKLYIKVSSQNFRHDKRAANFVFASLPATVAVVGTSGSSPLPRWTNPGATREVFSLDMAYNLEVVLPIRVELWPEIDFLRHPRTAEGSRRYINCKVLGHLKSVPHLTSLKSQAVLCVMTMGQTRKIISILRLKDIFFSLAGKEGRVYVFRLSDFEGEEQNEHVRTKADCKDHKLEKTRGKV